MKKKLLVVVGAGASIEFGMPSVSDIDSILDAKASEVCPLASDRASNLYRFIRDAIDAHYATAPKLALRKWSNFEEVLYQINLLSPYLSDADALHGSNALLKATSLPDVLLFGREVRAVDSGILHTLGSSLIDALVDEFVSRCGLAATAKAGDIAVLGTFFGQLAAEFDVGVLTLNYDNIITQAYAGLFTGFDPATGAFDARSVFERSEWNFIYHLHGSIHFAMTGRQLDMHGINWKAVPAVGHHGSSSGRNSQSSMEGVAYPTSTIVAGYGKTLQILRQPFRTYFAQASRVVLEADSLLFLGYGFGDLHLNAAFSEVRDRRRPTVVVGYADDGEDPLQFRNDAWSYNLLKTLPASAGAMAAPGRRSAPDVADLKLSGQPEVSNNPDFPLAVWYGGLLAACKNAGTIISHLM